MSRRTPIALVLAAVLSALLMPATSLAAGFATDSVPSTVKGENTKPFEFVSNAGTLNCNKALANGPMSLKVVTSLTLAPSFSECTFLGLFGVTVNPGACETRWNVSSGPPVTGTIDIVPPGCAGIVISAAGCTVTIPPQSGLATITYVVSSGPPDTITSTVNVSGVTYTSTAGCPSGSGTFTNGVMRVTERLRAFVGGVLHFLRIQP